MSECTCHKNYTLDTLIPKVGVITDIREETPDVKTFRVNAPEGGKLFEHMPGQCAMLCEPGVSEGMFSITSSPTNREYQEFSIKKCGSLTSYLHSLEVGDEITVRRFCQQIFYQLRQRLALFALCLPVQSFSCHPDGDIGLRICAINPKRFTETGILRLVTSHRHDRAVRSPGCIKGIHRICQKYLVEHLHTAQVAGFHAKYDKWLLL